MFHQEIPTGCRPRNDTVVDTWLQKMLLRPVPVLPPSLISQKCPYRSFLTASPGGEAEGAAPWEPSLCVFHSITVSKVTIMTTLHTMEMELTALDSPTSPPRSAVKPGTAEPIGLKVRITRACRTSRSKGSRK